MAIYNDALLLEESFEDDLIFATEEFFSDNDPVVSFLENCNRVSIDVLTESEETLGEKFKNAKAKVVAGIQRAVEAVKKKIGEFIEWVQDNVFSARYKMVKKRAESCLNKISYGNISNPFFEKNVVEYYDPEKVFSTISKSYSDFKDNMKKAMKQIAKDEEKFMSNVENFFPDTFKKKIVSYREAAAYLKDVIINDTLVKQCREMLKDAKEMLKVLDASLTALKRDKENREENAGQIAVIRTSCTYMSKIITGYNKLINDMFHTTKVICKACDKNAKDIKSVNKMGKKLSKSEQNAIDTY